MIDLVGNNGLVQGYGPRLTVCHARLNGAVAAATNMVLLDNLGIKTVLQTVTGLFVVTLAEKFAEFVPVVYAIAAGADQHDCAVTAVDFTAGTFSFSHYVQTARAGAHALNGGNSPATVFNIVVIGRSAM